MNRSLSLFAALTLIAPTVAAEPLSVRVTKSKDAIEFSAGDALVTRYHLGETVAKPYFWPLNAPGGVPVTRGWPMQEGLPNETRDHVHQKSAWFCHGDVIPEGLELKVRSADKNVKGVDFWSEGRGHGIIACVSVGDARVTTGASSVNTRNEWRTADGTKILDEDRTITVRLLGDARLVVLDIDLHATVCPITFGDTKEGSMGVRVNDQFRLNGPRSDGVVTSADGAVAKAPAKDNLPMWGKPGDWHDYSGTVDGKRVGIAIFDHPKNAPRALWHTRAYGLMAANPFGRASFPGGKGELTKLGKGDHLKLRYGILLHAGDAKEGKVAEHYAAFAKK
jgi:Methane oxygenase PmoA